jgi:hypothetical protein
MDIAMDKKLYIANWELHHNEVIIAPEEPIALTKDEAQPLLDNGTIRRARVIEKQEAVDLPDDFPKRPKLIAIGLHTIDLVDKATDAEICKIDRLGKGTLQLIRKRVEELKAETVAEE